ncbi:MAG TPA: hypothetical protein VGM90_38380 [Kofleriaceae bacterium]
MRRFLVPLLLLAGTAHADPIYLHAEVDPLTFANGGYGGQLGIRVRHVRFALASFSLHVPDVVSQIGNDGFDERIRPSGALYALYYLNAAGHDGFAFGASLRLLRIRYEHDDVPGTEAHVTELSPEAIVGYQWHPFHNGFYLQPWLALGVTVWKNHPGKVGTYTYDELPISPFFTVNIGWEQAVL